jgi:hypothetical protein
MKPVAWISVLGVDLIGQKFTDVRVSLTKTDVASIPLYTHPAKTLTDEEIQELALSDEFWISEDCTIFDWHKFAKAILKKAQGEG